MRPKALIYSLCLVAELLLFLYLYIEGPRGLLAIQALQKECSGIAQSCAALSQEVVGLEGEIDDWKHYPFLHEQRMRTDIHMADPASTWYFYKE